MHLSHIFKSSPHCVPSPDGKLIATLASTVINIRSTETLRTINVVKLPTGLSEPIASLLWSPSSTKLLVSTSEQVNVLSILDSSLNATIKNPTSGTGKPSHIQFGCNDNQLLVFAAFGLKLLIVNLSTSKAVEIGSPKFHLPISATRGFSLRPRTGHLALLTRVGGRDILSIHDHATQQLQRSWHPETADAQVVIWSPNGQWLLLWDSAAHGRRLLLYTPDGQLFRTLGGADAPNVEEAKLKLGIKLCKFSPDAQLCAVSDHTRSVAIFGTSAWREDLSLTHPLSLPLSDTLQVWQEQLQGTTPSFVRATQVISPPVSVADGKFPKELAPGCSIASFDASSTLLATRLDDSPSTLWVWDLATAELRAVLIFHSSVDFQWHPSVRELLLITCQDDIHRGLPFIWDPLSTGPTFVNLAEQFPSGKVTGKSQIHWINWGEESPILFLSDAQYFCLLSLSDASQGPTHWHKDGGSSIMDQGSTREAFSVMRGEVHFPNEGVFGEDDTSVLEDTFSFKHGSSILAKGV